MFSSKPRAESEQQILLIVDETDEQRTDESVLIESGYSADAVKALTGEDAFHVLFGDGDEKASRKPSLVIIDLDHTREPGRSVLQHLVTELKDDAAHRVIPVLLLVRESQHEDVLAWYKTGVNAVAVRPESHDDMVAFFKSVRAFWSENVTLADDLWP
ncbi:MAG TPA: hypothetical protein VFG50_13210 [Rhodothermales bacterium]|nr:hypothetical protein [Rhodothermales bacterium]